MAKLPPIDLSDLLKLLKTEGSSELQAACLTKLGGFDILREWNKILRELEIIIPKLAEGAEIGSLKASALGLAKSVGTLASMTSQILSFVPGPVGIVCSVVNAIVCFCTIPFPVNIGNGMLELLGCIPGGKVAGKLAPKVEKILLKVIENSPDLRKVIETGEKINVAVKKFSERAAKNIQNSKIGKKMTESGISTQRPKTVGGKLDIDESTFYSGQSSQSLLFEGNQIVRRYQIQPRPISNIGNPLANVYSHLIKVLFLLVVLSAFAINVSAQNSSDIDNYIAKYKQIALEQEKIYGIPAPITLAQGILESGAGRSGLVRNANNHFGIKAYGGWTGRVYLAWDDETAKSKFRWYNSASESYKDHSLFLKNNGRYRSLFSKSVYDYRGWANGLQQAGYATSQTYAKALIGYIDTYQLYAINGGVKLRPGKTVTITKTITKEELVVRKDLRLEESEASEEQESVESTIKRYVVEINGVRCTILYPGETLSSIAMKYDIPKSKILEYNETTSENDLREGDVVFLDKKKNKYLGAQDYYKVKEGETMYSISQQFGIKLANLIKINNKSFFSNLSEGETIMLKK